MPENQEERILVYQCFWMVFRLYIYIVSITIYHFILRKQQRDNVLMLSISPSVRPDGHTCSFQQILTKRTPSLCSLVVHIVRMFLLEWSSLSHCRSCFSVSLHIMVPYLPREDEVRDVGTYITRVVINNVFYLSWSRRNAGSVPYIPYIYSHRNVSKYNYILLKSYTCRYGLVSLAYSHINVSKSIYIIEVVEMQVVSHISSI